MLHKSRHSLVLYEAKFDGKPRQFGLWHIYRLLLACRIPSKAQLAKPGAQKKNLVVGQGEKRLTQPCRARFMRRPSRLIEKKQYVAFQN